MKQILANLAPLQLMEKLKREFEVKKRIEEHSKNFNPDKMLNFWDRFNTGHYLKIQAIKNKQIKAI